MVCLLNTNFFLSWNWGSDTQNPGSPHPSLHASPAEGVQEGSASTVKGGRSGLLGAVMGCPVGMDKRGLLFMKARHRGAGEAHSLTRALGEAGGGPSCTTSN